MAIIEKFFASRPLASQAAARRVAKSITCGLYDTPEVAIVVGGGSTPTNCYEILANTVLPWDKVHILPSDERCVPADHEASNQGMIRRSLVTNYAANAKLVSIYEEGLPHGRQCALLSKMPGALPLPFSISILGMGEDGHFASLFADMVDLEKGLGLDGGPPCLPVQTAASPMPRITLTMSTLLQSRQILLLFFGHAKRKIYEQAKTPGSCYPLARLLQQQRTPVRAIWAP